MTSCDVVNDVVVDVVEKSGGAMSNFSLELSNLHLHYCLTIAIVPRYT